MGVRALGGIGGVLLMAAMTGGCGGAAGAGGPSPVGRPTTGAAAPVEAQLLAYNAHDLEAFLEPYAEDVVLHATEGDSAKVLRGKPAMRAAYAWLRSAPPGFRAEIVSRSVMGRYVIDHERVVRPGRDPVEVVAIYEVAGGRIVSVRFLPDP